MKVPTVYSPSVKPSRQGLGYLQAQSADISGVARAGQRLAGSIAAFGARKQQEQERLDREREAEITRLETEAAKRSEATRRFKTLTDFTTFETRANDMLTEQLKNADPADTNVRDRIRESFTNLRADFLSSIDPEFQEEYSYRTAVVGASIDGQSRDKQYALQQGYFNTQLDGLMESAKTSLDQQPSFDNLTLWTQRMMEAVDSTDLSDVEKAAKKATVNRDLQTILYRQEVTSGNTYRPGTGKVEAGSVGDIISRSAQELGIKPEELALAIAYETGGRFSTSIYGGKGGNYLGLIQFGPEEQQKYGVHPGQTFEEQMKSVVAFLRDRGLKPGMGLLDLYSTINAGSPGRYGASDGPGNTVLTHVQKMLASPYKTQAEGLVNGKLSFDGIDNDPRFQAVLYEDRLAARKDAEAAWQAEQTAADKMITEQYNSSFNTLMTGISDGRAGQNDLDAFREANPGMDYKDIAAAQKALDERGKESRFMEEARAFVASGRPVDPNNADHKKYLNAVMGADGVERLGQRDEGFFTNTLLPLVKQTGDIPTDAVGTLTGMVRSANGPSQLFALDALSQIRNVNPRAFDARVPDALARDVDLWEGSKGYLDQNQLLEVIRGGTTQEMRQAQAVLREEARGLLRDKNNPNHVSFTTVVDAFDEWFAAPGVGGGPAAKVVMQSEFNSLFEFEYARDGNSEAAAARAIKQMQRDWGVTGATGSRYIMKYPPEKFYPPVTGGHEWIDQQTRIEHRLGPGDRVELLSDRQTAQEVAAFKQGGPPPSYGVVYYRDGVAHAVTDDNGQPIRQFFEKTPELTKLDEADISYKQQQALDRIWYKNVYQAALMAGARTGQGVPQDIKDEWEERKKRLSEMQIDAKKAGVPQIPRLTGDTSVSGRPLYDDGNGNVYSEKTVTFPLNGKWVTFPSVDENGYIMSEDRVARYVKRNGPIDPITGEKFPVFNSRKEAEDYAQQRSKTRVAEPTKRPVEKLFQVEPR